MSGVQPEAGTHWVPLQISPLVHVPQSRLPPQPSPTVPQYLPAPLPHAMGVQLGPPLHRWPVQVQPDGQALLHVRVPPQRFPRSPPQYWPPVGLQVSGVQAPLGMHWLPLQVSLATQPPQSRLPPQPSPIAPQYLPAPVPQVAGTQLAPPLHRWLTQSQPDGHGAVQSSEPPQPLPMPAPQY